ncbi:MAG: hypothetical protein KGL36_08140 [Gammaproteobacteria bacterium]|nr:hypothetical protein [Gammaproteobacteria bacterium]
MNKVHALLTKIGQINARYRTPRIAMSGAVRGSLLVLRLYLIGLVLLMVYGFVRIVTRG